MKRREFLKGTAAVAAAGVMAPLHVSFAEEEAAEMTMEEDVPAWLGKEPEIDEDQVAETFEADVVVVGAGTSGCFAACSAVENGADTILIERFPEEFGGSGIRDTLAAIGSRQQLEDGDNPDKYDVITELYRQSNGYGDQRLYKVWADNSGEAIDWYTDRCAEAGLTIRHEVDTHDIPVRYPIYDVGHSLQMSQTLGAHGVTANVLKDYGKGLGLVIHYDTTMIKLIKEEGKVVGLYAENVDGQVVRYLAKKGVILCTGGYSLNPEMLEALQPETAKIVNINYSYPGSQGDGIKAALWAGAKMDETHTGMLFDRGGIAPDQVGPKPEGFLFWMGSQPFLKVDLNGNRFTNESGCYDHLLHDAHNLPGMTYAVIWDANYVEDMARFDSHGCSRMFDHVNGAESVWPLAMNEAAFMAPLREAGMVVSADTIEELAQKLGLPAENLKATVDRYNELYDKQEDEDFGKEAFRLSELRTAPFEGVRMSGGYFICTMDGVKIDTNMNVLDQNGQPIEGLYAAGDTSGGYFSDSYPNLLAGAAAGRSVTFGRLAGKNAALR